MFEMMEKKKAEAKTIRPATLLWVFAATGAAFAWFSQNSIEAYWQKQYESASPIAPLAAYGWWRAGGDLSDAVFARLSGGAAEAPSDGMPGAGPGSKSKPLKAGPGTQAAPGETFGGPVSAAEGESRPKLFPPSPLKNGVVRLQAGDEVFFAGDSLMQGIVPFASRSLVQRWGVKSVNLSKQSTGLCYPKFFNWPETVETTLAGNPRIRLLVLMLGPNDAWDMPDPEGAGKPYLHFGSEKWTLHYRERVRSIIDSARSRGVAVVWLGVPAMKKPELDAKMQRLNEILKAEMGEGALWLPTRALLSPATGAFEDSAVVNGKLERLRTKDGIHFSPVGQRMLSNLLISHVEGDPLEPAASGSASAAASRPGASLSAGKEPSPQTTSQAPAPARVN